jgi:hypothetical protein
MEVNMNFQVIRQLALIFFPVLVSHSSFIHAAAEFSDGLVPVEVVTDIVGGNIYRSLPDGFPLPGAGLPEGMQHRLIASRSTNFQKDVYLRTESDADTFRLALADAYVASGWKDVSFSPSTFGITSANALRYVSLCHDELGSLNIDDNGSDSGESKILVRFRPANFIPFTMNGSSCAEFQALNEAGYPSGLLAFFQEQIPLLEGPETSQGAFGGIDRAPFFSSSSSNSVGQTYRTSQRGTLEIPLYQLIQLFIHLSTQLEEQGWSLENNTSSNSVSSSIWTRSVSAPDLPILDTDLWDMDLTGILTILDQGEDTWLVQFELWSE